MMLLLGTLGAAMLVAADWAPVITVPLAAAAGFLAPYLFILRKRKRRLQQIEDQFPDALDSLSRALRAGRSFGAGMDLVAGECPDPLAQKMRKAGATPSKISRAVCPCWKFACLPPRWPSRAVSAAGSTRSWKS